MALFETDFHHVHSEITLVLWFVVVSLAKIALHYLEKERWMKLPDSALLLLVGTSFGAVLHFLFPEEEFYLKPDWFFLYLLPPIALDAGFFLPNVEFFHNFGTICTYALLGTTWNVIALGVGLYSLADWFLEPNRTVDAVATAVIGVDEVTTSSGGQPSASLLMEFFVFATLLSAVDPVAVLCVFEEVHVNRLLYICVFGESMLNDAVTLVFYSTFNSMAEAHTGGAWVDYFFALLHFFGACIGGIVVGIGAALATGLTTKWASEIDVVQPLICLLFPYLAYLLAEGLKCSGVLATLVCGMLMKQYIRGNISRHSKLTVKYAIKTLSSCSEAMIFVFLGVSAVSRNHEFNVGFILLTITLSFLFRCIGIALLTAAVNCRRMERIQPVDQFIMAYGGLRGAESFGLAMSLNPALIRNKALFTTTTTIVIFFTVFIQGSTIRKLVSLLKVSQEEEEVPDVFHMLMNQELKHLQGGMESIVGLHGEYWQRSKIEYFNQHYLMPYITVQGGDETGYEHRAHQFLKVLSSGGGQLGMEEQQIYKNSNKKKLPLKRQPYSNNQVVLLPRDSSVELESGVMYSSGDEANGQTRHGKKGGFKRASSLSEREDSIGQLVRENLARINSVPQRRRYSRHFIPHTASGRVAEMSELDYSYNAEPMLDYTHRQQKHRLGGRDLATSSTITSRPVVFHSSTERPLTTKRPWSITTSDGDEEEDAGVAGGGERSLAISSGRDEDGATEGFVTARTTFTYFH